MRRASEGATGGRPGRRGFTLIELLVVVSILALLTALTAGAAIRFRAARATANTRTLLTRLDSRLRQQTAYVADRARRETPPGAVLSLAGGDPGRSKVIWQKLRFKQFFPTSFAEALDPAGGYVPPLPAYVNYLTEYGITGGSGTPAAHESAACLYMILRYGPESAGEDELGTGGAVKTVNGIPVLVDSWGNPLAFCRWPVGDTGNGVSPANPQGYQAGFNDPADPRGLLAAPSWLSSPQGAQFQAVCHPLRNGGTLDLSPLIVSAGPDGQLGLVTATLGVTNPGQANDNLYSNSLR
jgi:prepilin-type N-terminal cleavage/methylation domain-containing protein